MSAILHTATLFVALAVAAPAGAQVRAASAQTTTPVVQAFEHYELVRAALASDRLSDAAPHAKTLADRAEAAGGAEAKKAADLLAAARNIEDARKHFGDLSTIFVPIFQAAAIPGTTAYTCSMKQKPWVQRGDKIENPYYGKSMLACGTVLPAKK